MRQRIEYVEHLKEKLECHMIIITVIVNILLYKFPNTDEREMSRKIEMDISPFNSWPHLISLLNE